MKIVWYSQNEKDMTSTNMKIKENKKSNILDDLVTKKILRQLKEEIAEDSENLTLYFVYRVRHFGIDSYLLTQSKNIDAENSFTESFFSNETLKQKILKDEEIPYIIEYALSLSEVNELLDNITIFKTNLNSHQKLCSIIDLFNRCNIKELKKLRQRQKTNFKLLLKVALLSIPQLSASEDYSGFSSNLSSNKLLISGEVKFGKCKKLVEDFNNNLLENSLPDRLLLLVTIIEGYLWEIADEGERDDSGGLYSFCVGDLYEILYSQIDKIAFEGIKYLKEEVIYNIRNHWFYLQQFRFYIYGEIKLYEEEDLKRQLCEIFISNLSDLILFTKSVITKSNADNVQTWSELSNTLKPNSIAHGIISISPPTKIGIFNLDENNKFVLSDNNSFFIREHESIANLENLNNPWALYKVCEEEVNLELSIKNLKELKENGFLVKDNYLVIRVMNVFEKKLYIILEVNDNSEKQMILSNFKFYKYVFKSFVEELQLINRSSSLNINPTSWHKKAFCNLYKDYDIIRYDKQYGPNFRDWELKRIKEILKDKSNVIIYDIGACYGRLEENIINDKDLIDGEDIRLIEKIDKIYAIDQNQDYLQIVQTLDKNKIQTRRWDFKEIGLIDEKKADLICFTHTVFGYFNDDADNELVLKKAFEMLKVGGVIMIDQFNPNQPPQHCNQSTIPVYNFPDKKVGPYSCIKTSNHSTPEKTGGSYGLYYGNYIYFEIRDEISEKIVKCDTYSIKLYIEDWFKEVLGRNGYTHKTDYDIVTNEDKDDGTTMLITITKKENKGTTKEEDKRNTAAY